MRALKALVIFMGVLIILGLVVLGYGLYIKAKKVTSEAPPTLAAAPDRPVTGEFGDVQLKMPLGATVEQMEAVAGRLVVRLAGNGSDRIIIIDPLTGRVTGTIALVPTAP